MLNKKFIGLIIPLILLNLSILGGFSIVYRTDMPKISDTAPMKNMVMDGVIQESEWSDADWKVGFYLDIDDVGNPPDTDGMNYLYLGEDANNIFVGLDLCSDKTGDITGEWVGAWLNTNNRTFTELSTWVSYLDDGAESFIHDVENDVPLPYFLNVSSIGWGVFPNSDSQYNAVYGSVEGNYTLLDQSAGQPTFNITSVKNNTNYLVQVDFSIDIKDYFSYFQELYANATIKVNLNTFGIVNTTISNYEVVLWYNNGTMNRNDPDQTFLLSTLLVNEYNTFLAGNFTSDHKMQFSLLANHSNPFKIQLHHMSFGIFHLDENNFGSAFTNPYSSISDYQIEWGFGPSFNNASDHRMYEIRIPKSELEHYDSDADLGIIVGGYGTMSFLNTKYWVYSQLNDRIRQTTSENYWYFNMLGLTVPTGSGDNLLIIITTTTIVIIGIIAIASIILIRKRLK